MMRRLALQRARRSRETAYAEGHWLQDKQGQGMACRTRPWPRALGIATVRSSP